MEALILDLVQKYPAIASVLMVMGAFRAVLKPLMAYLEQRALETDSQEDDKRLAKIKASRAYKVLAFLLDYAASVKLPR